MRSHLTTQIFPDFFLQRKECFKMACSSARFGFASLIIFFQSQDCLAIVREIFIQLTETGIDGFIGASADTWQAVQFELSAI
jgi:hypothetical protein